MKQRFPSLSEYVNEALSYGKILNANDIIRIIEDSKYYKIVRDISQGNILKFCVRTEGNNNKSDMILMQKLHTNGIVIEGDIEDGEFCIEYDTKRIKESVDDYRVYFVAKEIQSGKYVVKHASKHTDRAKTGSLRFKTEDEAQKEADKLNAKNESKQLTDLDKILNGLDYKKLDKIKIDADYNNELLRQASKLGYELTGEELIDLRTLIANANESELEPKKVLSAILKKNARFKWLKDELPKDYDLLDIENVLTNAGYGSVYGEVCSALQESTINEGTDDINLENKFALVCIGGSIGGKAQYPIFVGRDSGSIIMTGDDKEALVETKKRRNSQLTPGEKSYYGMKYKVIEITPSVKKTIAYLQDYQNKADDTTVSEASLTDWIIPGVPVNIMSMYGFVTNITKEMNGVVYEFDFINLEGEPHKAVNIGDKFVLKESENINEDKLSPEMTKSFHEQYDETIKKFKIEVRGEPLMSFGKFACPIYVYNVIKNNFVIGARLTKSEADNTIDIIKNAFAWQLPDVRVEKDAGFIYTDQLEALKKQK